MKNERSATAQTGKFTLPPSIARIPGFTAIIAAFMLLAVFSLTAAAEDGCTKIKTVKVPFYQSSNTFTTLNQSGQPVGGYAYEYIETIAEYAGWKIEYVSCGSFSEMLQMAIKGDIDFAFGVSHSPKLAARLLFPDHPMGTEEYYLFCNAVDKPTPPGDYSALNGKRAGVTTGTLQGEYLEKWCRQKGIKLSIVEFASTAAKENALKSGAIDLDMETDMLANGNLAIVEKITSDNRYYLAASRARQDLINEFNEAYHKITGINRFFFSNLEEKYVSQSVASKTPYADEAAWIARHRTLTIGYLNSYMPFSNMGKRSKPTGIIADIVPLMFNNIGLQNVLQIKYLCFDSTKEMYASLDQGTTDMIFPVYGSTNFARGKNASFSKSIVNVPLHIAYFTPHADRMTRIIAVNRKNELQDFYSRHFYPDSTIKYYDTIEECLNAVNTGKADSTILNGLRTSNLLLNRNKVYPHVNVQVLPRTADFNFAVKHGNYQLLSLVNRAVVCTGRNLFFSLLSKHSRTPYTSADFLKEHLAETVVIVISLIIAVLTILLALSRKLNRRLAESNRQISQQQKEVEKSKELAEAANRSKTFFLFNMSHDIRTPMNAIIGFTNMAIKHINDKDKALNSLQKVQQSGNMLLQLINSVLEFSRIEAGKETLAEQREDIRNSFSDIKSTMQELAHAKDIALTFAFGEIRDRYVFCDLGRCIRVFVNIISNAIKYTREGGYVKVRCEQLGEARDGRGIYQYIVTDNGIGMSEEFQKHVFDQFSRERTATVSGIQGTGLGMSVCKSFVDMMGGTITCRSQQGKGTTFTITLPFKLQNDVPFTDSATGEVTTPAATPKAPKLDFTGKKVLLADDNELNREIAVEILTDEGLLVEEAADGSRAVALVKEKGADFYDFVLMDIQMPTMNGYEATRNIREMFPDAKLPIIALSANAFAEDKAASLAAGMNDHVAKPINIKELHKVLTKFL